VTKKKSVFKSCTSEIICLLSCIRLLQTEGNVNEHVGYETIEPRNLIQSNELNAEKTKENKWIEVIPSHYRRTKQVKIYPSIRQVEIENHYKVLENLQEPTEIVDGPEFGKLRGVTNVHRRNLKKEVP
jgi:hypothetical protein